MPFDSPQADNPKVTFDDLMARGMAAHTAGDPVKALTAFESALALHPQKPQAVSACAALLFELSRPRSAFTLLQSIESQLLIDADGCANLGVAALSCGQEKAAASYFQQAIELEPHHSAALTHLGLLAAREQRWLDAIGFARQSARCSPNDETAHANLVDYLLGARRPSEALAQWQVLPEPIKSHPQVAIRQVVALALNAEFDAAHRVMNQLNPQALSELTLFLQRGGAADLKDLFYRQAQDAMHECDWRDYPRLFSIVGQENLHQGFSSSPNVGMTSKAKAPPPFAVHRRANEPADCIHIGIAAISLRDTPATEALAAELSHYDRARFRFHVYSPTPQPQVALSAPLSAHNVVEIGHFTDDEAVWRIRLDRLDILLDMTLHTRWHRPGIAYYRVAPIQVEALPTARQQQSPAGTYDYALSDPIIEGSNSFIQTGTALALFPQTCWSAPDTFKAADSKLSRQSAGLSPDSFVYCGFGPSAKIRPTTFASWMHLLQLEPNALLWLSSCSANAQANLWREAMLAGIQAQRIIFAKADSNELSLLPLADLYLDMPGNCDAPSLIQALRAGVPAITAIGSTTASRMGGSILDAAGLSDCIFECREAMFAHALHLAQNPTALQALRERMQLHVSQSPLFDVPRRAKERAMVWTRMVERSRAGLAPATLNTADFKLS
jgi:predicted O-linked N-acetylglucosamine transferase (SPINDLY family)